MLSDRSKNSLAAVPLLAAMLLNGCGEKSPETPPKPDVPEAVRKTASDVPAPEQHSRGFPEVPESVRHFGSEAYETARGYANRAIHAANEKIHDPAVAAKINAASEAFGRNLEKLANDPNRPRTTSEHIVNAAMNKAPLLRSANGYADARAMYARYKDGEDPESIAMTQKSKRMCLLACTRLGLDVTTLGLPAALDMPFDLADDVVTGLDLTQKASGAAEHMPGWVPVSWTNIDPKSIDLLGPVLDRALENQTIDSAMVTLLEVDYSKPWVPLEE